MGILEGHPTERWEKIPKNVYNCDPIPYKQCIKSESKSDMRTVNTGEENKKYFYKAMLAVECTDDTVLEEMTVKKLI